MLVWKHFRMKVCPSLDFMTTQSTNSERLLAKRILRAIQKDCHSLQKDSLEHGYSAAKFMHCS